MPNYELYGGDVTLDFDEKKHTYTVTDGDTKLVNVVPSVTGITKIIDKSGPLMWWAVQCCVDYVDANIGSVDLNDEIVRKQFFHDAHRAHMRVSKQAADIGTLVHEWIDDFLMEKVNRKDLPTNPSARSSCITFLEWFDEHVEAVYETEFKCYSKEHGYAGTADFDGIVDGKRSLVDWKTSKAIYPEYEIQGNAYIMAREEELGVEYESLWIIALPKDGGPIKAKRFTPSQKAQDGFLGALALWRSLKEKSK